MAPVNLIDPATKRTFAVDEAEVPILLGQDWRREDARQAAERTATDTITEQHSGLGDQVKAAAAATLRGASFGATDVLSSLGPGGDERMRDLQRLREANPGISTGFEIGGAVLPALVSGGAGGVGALARATPAGAIAELGAGIAARGAGKGLVREAAAMGAGAAVEGVAQGVGSYLSTQALEDRDITAEGLIASGAKGGLFAGGAGAALGLSLGATTSLRKMFAKSDVTEEAAKLAERKAATELEGALRDSTDLEKVARDQISAHRRARTAVDPLAAQAADDIRAAKVAEAQARARGAGELASTRAANREAAELRLERTRAKSPRPGDVPVQEPAAVANVADVTTPPIDVAAAPAPAVTGTGKKYMRGGKLMDEAEFAASFRGGKAAPKAKPSPEAPSAEPRRIERSVESPGVPDNVSDDDVSKFMDHVHRNFRSDLTFDDVVKGFEPPPGYKAKIAELGSDGSIEIKLFDDGGKPVGKLSRTFDENGKIQNRAIEIAEAHRGKGLGDYLHRNAIDTYRNIGAKDVAINAQGVGKYTWASRGYRFEEPEKIAKAADAFAKKFAPDRADEIAALIKQNIDDPAKLAKLSDGTKYKIDYNDLHKTQSGEFDLGKAFLLSGNNWKGRMALESSDVGRAARVPGVGVDDAERAIDDAIADMDPKAAKLKALADQVRDTRGDLESLLKLSVDRLKAGDTMAEHAAVVRPADRVQTWNPMLYRHIVGGGSISDLEQRAALQAFRDAAAKPPVNVQDQIAKSLRGSIDAPDDLAQAIPLIQKLEKAEAEIARELGPELVPPGTARRADEYQRAMDDHVGAQSTAEAQTAQAINDVAPAALAENASKKGFMSAAADAGAMLEVMSALNVPGLPSPHDLPVVGPLLGLYLKARAAMSVWRRLGGKIPASVETEVATRSASTRNRMRAAVDSMLDAGQKTARVAARPAPLIAEQLSRRLFADENDAPHKDAGDSVETLWAKRLDEVRRAQEPGAMARSLRDRVRTADPLLAQAIVSAEQRKIDYIAKEIPRPPMSMSLGGKQAEWRPAPAQEAKFARTLEALHDPNAVLENAITGDVAIDQMRAIRAVYPKLFASAQAQLIEGLTGRDDVSYARRIQLGLLFDIPLDSTQAPEFVAKQQAGFASQKPPAPPPPAMPTAPAPSIVGSLNTLTSNYALQEQR